MKATELVAQLLDIIVKKGDQEVWVHNNISDSVRVPEVDTSMGEPEYWWCQDCGQIWYQSSKPEGCPACLEIDEINCQPFEGITV